MRLPNKLNGGGKVKISGSLIQFFKMLRVKHYIKNLIILIPVFFAGKLFTPSFFPPSLIAFISFCFVSSTVYIINDISDREQDRLHEIKKNRPIASGAISVPFAIVTVVALLGVTVIMLVVFAREKIWISVTFLSGYILMNIAYSLKLKNIPIIDIAILASGFLLRIFYGGAIVDISLSNWLILTILAVTFFLGFGKRRGEIQKTDNSTRKVLSAYSYNFLDKSMYMCLTLAICFYALWSVDADTVNRLGGKTMVWTIPLLLIIVFRYCLSIEGDDYADPVDTILEDKLLIILVVLYAVVMGAVLYGEFIFSM